MHRHGQLVTPLNSILTNNGRRRKSWPAKGRGIWAHGLSLISSLFLCIHCWPAYQTLAFFHYFLYQMGMMGSRSGALTSTRPARRGRGLRDCHTLSRVNTVWFKQKKPRYWLSSMLGPMLWNPKIASSCSGSVKQAGASEQESQKTDSVQELWKMACNSCSPIYRTYLLTPKFSTLWMPT